MHFVWCPSIYLSIALDDCDFRFDLQTIPSDLAKNVKILNLDLGNNFIERSSDLKVCTYHCLPINPSMNYFDRNSHLFRCQVLSELRYLRNLNLQGNPVSEKDSLIKKVIPPDQLDFFFFWVCTAIL